MYRVYRNIYKSGTSRDYATRYAADQGAHKPRAAVIRVEGDSLTVQDVGEIRQPIIVGDKMIGEAVITAVVTEPHTRKEIPISEVKGRIYRNVYKGGYQSRNFSTREEAETYAGKPRAGVLCIERDSVTVEDVYEIKKNVMVYGKILGQVVISVTIE